MNRGSGRRGPASLADLQAWEALIRDPSPPLMPPYGMEKQARDQYGVTYNPTIDDDRDELQRLSWPWSTACIWVAWRTFDGSADALAAFRLWSGMIWREGREGDPDVRPGRLMPLPAAERELRNALEAGTVRATAIRADGEVLIPAGEWPRLAWEKMEHGEVIEFDHLTMLGARRYSGVVIPRAALLQAWPALDGWAPVGSDVVDIDPINVREVRPTTDEMNVVRLGLLGAPARQEHINAAAAKLPEGLALDVRRKGQRRRYPFHDALVASFGPLRRSESRIAWDHYPHNKGPGRPGTIAGNAAKT